MIKKILHFPIQNHLSIFKKSSEVKIQKKEETFGKFPWIHKSNGSNLS